MIDGTACVSSRWRSSLARNRSSLSRTAASFFLAVVNTTAAAQRIAAHRLRLNQAYSNIPPGRDTPISTTLKRAPITATNHMRRGVDFGILNASHNGTAYNSQIPNPKGIQISISKIPTVNRMMKIDQSFLRKMNWLIASSAEPDQTERNE